MRYTEIKLSQDTLLEINMKPSRLRQAVADIKSTCGMEFELYVPNAAQSGDEFGDTEQDLSYDDRVGNDDISSVMDFFGDGNEFNDSNSLRNARGQLEEEFSDWISNEFDNFWQKNEYDLVQDWLQDNDPVEDGADEEEYITQTIEDRNSNWDSAQDLARENYDQNMEWGDWGDFWRHLGIRNFSDLVDAGYELQWPHWHTPERDDGISYTDVANEFSSAMGRQVAVNTSYHGSVDRDKASNSMTYIMEPDSSLDQPMDDADGGLEFVSPKMSFADMLSDLEKIQKWASSQGVYSNDSTGLHMNISIDAYDNRLVDWVKLAILLGDEYVLGEFGREANQYCQAAIGMVKSKIAKNPQGVPDVLEQMRSGMISMASAAIHNGKTGKYVSINNKNGYIEFRSPGGDWLQDLADGQKIQNTLMRFVVALDAANNPEKFKQEYQKKLYQLLEPSIKRQGNSVSYFADYVAGITPRAALKQFVTTLQLERETTPSGRNTRNFIVSNADVAGDSGSLMVSANSTQDAITSAQRQQPNWNDRSKLTAVLSSETPNSTAVSTKLYNWLVTKPTDHQFRVQFKVYTVAHNAVEAIQLARLASGQTDSDRYKDTDYVAQPVSRFVSVSGTDKINDSNNEYFIYLKSNSMLPNPHPMVGNQPGELTRWAQARGLPVDQYSLYTNSGVNRKPPVNNVKYFIVKASDPGTILHVFLAQPSAADADAKLVFAQWFAAQGESAEGYAYHSERDHARMSQLSAKNKSQ
jgi:hypothetical protein